MFKVGAIGSQFGQDLSVAQHDSEQVVEIVRHTACQLAYGLESLGTGQLGLEGDALRDIGDAAHHAYRFALIIANNKTPVFNIGQRAIGTHNPVRGVPGGQRIERMRPALFNAGTIVGMNAGQPACVSLVRDRRRTAKNAFEPAAPPAGCLFKVQIPGGIAGGLRQQAKTLFAGTQGSFSVYALHNVVFQRAVKFFKLLRALFELANERFAVLLEDVGLVSLGWRCACLATRTGQRVLDDLQHVLRFRRFQYEIVGP